MQQPDEAQGQSGTVDALQYLEPDVDAAPPLLDEDEDLDALGLGAGAGEDHVVEAAEPSPEEAEQQPEARERGAADDFALLEEQGGHQSEAEEEEDPLVSKQRRERDEVARTAAEIANLVSKMEQCIDADVDSVARGKPAKYKLTVLKDMEAQVGKLKTHQLLLQSGFLGLLKGFLEPLEQPVRKRGRDGTMVNKLALPHQRIREAVYRTLQRLPLDTHHQEARDHIKRSQIGPVLRFYSKVEQETAQNRRLLGNLLLGWTMPIVEEGREVMRDRRAEADEKQAAMESQRRERAIQHATEDREARRLKEEQAGKTVGDSGYRYHARVPRARRPDYINAPAPTVRAVASEQSGKSKGGTMEFIKKTNHALKRQRKSAATRTGRLELSTKNVGHDIV